LQELSAVALRETERKAWKAWASAKAACDQGLVARPLSLFVEATKLAPTVVYLDAAEFALNLNRSLERLAPIYQRHARSFDLAPDTYPIYLPGTKIGPEGWEFVLNCLLAANVAEPSRLGVREKIADVLEERGRFGEALAWRHGVEAADPESYGNSMAIGQLLAKSGHLADAEAHYLRIEAQRPHNVEVLLRLISIFPEEGEKFKLLSVVDRIDRELTLEERRSSIDHQVFFLGLILEIVRQWPISASRELLQRLRTRCDKLTRAGQSNVRILLTDAFLAFIESDFDRSARPRLCKATIEVERADTSIDIPEKAAEMVAEAANYARVLISNPGFPSREYEPLPEINAAVLAREQARTLLDEGKAGDALPKYAVSLKAYYVTDVPMQYELVGDHKLVLHEQCYYAFPRSIREFMIWEGTVYRLTGIGRHTKRRIPAWLMSLLFPYLGLFRNLAAKAREWKARAASVGAAIVLEYGARILQSVRWAVRIGRSSGKAIRLRAVAAMRRIDRAVPQLRPFLRPAVRLACKIWYGSLRTALGRKIESGRAALRPYVGGVFRLWYNPRLRSIIRGRRDRLLQMVKALTYSLKRMIFKISWSRYTVQGVVTAHRREAALGLIAKISNVPLAADGAGSRVVRRARLTRISASGSGA
jgi:tetratricopeptide (TPR) repeat protein